MATPTSPTTTTTTSDNIVNPICIILVKNGSKGDRLLFRYPYKHSPLSSSGDNTSPTSICTPPHPPQNQSTSSNLPLPVLVGDPQQIPRRRKVSSTSNNDANNRPVPVVNVANANNATVVVDTNVWNEPITTSSPFPPFTSGDSNSSQSPNFVASPLRPEGRSGSINSRPARKISRTSPAGLLFSNLRRSPADKSANSGTSGGDVFVDDQNETNYRSNDMEKFSPADGAKMLGELSDKDLSNLLAVPTELSERKFELKLNYLRFVGHPTLMQHPKLYRSLNQQGLQTSVKLFHIVFCLNAVASHSIVKCFHDLSKRLGIALRHEEYRCNYLSTEFKKIVALHDEICMEQWQSDKVAEERLRNKMFDEILSKSKLARLMKAIYNDVVEKGRTFLRVNGWIQISFCLPQKIHTLKFRDGQGALVEPEAIHKCLEAIRPYHAILLLVEPDELNDTLWLDASSTISRLLQVYSPLKSLQTLAADADLTLSHTVEIASHLVYWSQATVIYPLCESNVYVVAPDIPITSEALGKEFKQHFPSLSLSQVMADFSLPMPLGERTNVILGGNFVQAQQVQLVTWMLKYHLLIHLHTYVYLTTYFDGTTLLDSGGDYLFAFTGNRNGSANYSLNIRPFEADEDEATASDSFSETALDDVNIITTEIAAIIVTTTTGVEEGGVDEKDGSSSLPEATPPKNTTSATDAAADHGVNNNVPLGDAFPDLNEAVKRAVSIIKSPLTAQDVRMFSRLSKYFTGDFHIEEIMYRENVKRSQLMLLLDKFRDVLITIEKEDAEINFFQFS